MANGGTIEQPVLSTVGDGVGTMAGTSLAAAEVTGAVSQVWAANPQLSYRQVIEIIKSTATDLDAPNWDVITGVGLLNLAAAVLLAKVTTPETYNPEPFLTPTTWGGEGKVTPTERAVDFNGQIQNKIAVQINGGANIRSGPGTSYRQVGKISPGATLIFDRETQGELVIDPNGEGRSSTWYHLADGRGWMSAVYIQKISSPTSTLTPTSITINGYTIRGSFYPVFQNYRGTLGNPISGVINYSNGVSYQLFQNGSIVSSPYGTFPLYGGIRKAYLNTGGLDGWLGAPKSAEIGQGNGVIIQYFANGYIIWNGAKATAYRTGSGTSSKQAPSSTPLVTLIRTGSSTSGDKLVDQINTVSSKVNQLENEIDYRKKELPGLYSRTIQISREIGEYNRKISTLESERDEKKANVKRLRKSWGPWDWAYADRIEKEVKELESNILPPLYEAKKKLEVKLSQVQATINMIANQKPQELNSLRQELETLKKRERKEFVNPMKTKYTINQKYDAPGHNATGTHWGIDLAPLDPLEKNPPAYATAAGKVLWAGWRDGGYGKVVKIDHGDGLTTIYMHLDLVSVTVSQDVRRSQQIGIIGSTGNSTGTHLHFQVEQNGQHQNPRNYVTL
jgi:murein DD-endopeptidase MepM/ murein hydrolase activator NlpD